MPELTIASSSVLIVMRDSVHGGSTKFAQVFRGFYLELCVHRGDVRYGDGTAIFPAFEKYAILKSVVTNKV